MTRILLVRHGRSSHLPTGWFNRADMLAWQTAYDEAGLASGEAPTPAVRALAEEAGIIVTSDMRRAVESGVLIAGGRDVVQSPLLREAPLHIPALGRARLPLYGWAVVIGARWWRDLARDRPETPSPARTRAVDATAWLRALAESHGSVLAVTHSAFRRYLAEALVADGWAAESERRRRHTWSAWAFARRGGTGSA